MDMFFSLILAVALIGVTAALVTKLNNVQKKVSSLEKYISDCTARITNLEKEETVILTNGLNAFKYDDKSKTTTVTGSLKVSGSVSAGETSTN